MTDVKIELYPEDLQIGQYNEDEVVQIVPSKAFNEKFIARMRSLGVTNYAKDVSEDEVQNEE